jgi:hypothetical protein
MQPKRNRGGQPGNHNAAKHGIEPDLQVRSGSNMDFTHELAFF